MAAALAGLTSPSGGAGVTPGATGLAGGLVATLTGAGLLAAEVMLASMRQ